MPDVDITLFPAQLSDILGVDVFTAQLILSAVALIFTVCLVGYIIKKGTALTYGLLVTEFVVMAALIGLGWLPYWILLVMSLAVGLMFAATMRDFITRG